MGTQIQPILYVNPQDFSKSFIKILFGMEKNIYNLNVVISRYWQIRFALCNMKITFLKRTNIWNPVICAAIYSVIVQYFLENPDSQHLSTLEVT